MDNRPQSHCDSSAGAVGSAAAPFCTITAAVDKVGPGGTVVVLGGDYFEDVNVGVSGSAGAPVTIKNTGRNTEFWPLTAGFTVRGQHDVVIDGFPVLGVADSIVVSDSQRITLSHNQVGGSQTTGTGIHLTNVADSAVIANQVQQSNDGIAVDGGSSNVVVADDIISQTHGVGVRVRDSAGTDVTNNTVFGSACVGVAVTGSATGTSIQNNILTANGDNNACASTGEDSVGQLAVTASTSDTVDDYNDVYTGNGSNGFLYTWDGKRYTAVPAFTSDTQQGTHDLVSYDGSGYGSGPGLYVPAYAAVDSANASAPGVQPVDYYGNTPTDDPSLSNTGVGNPSFLDRGAVENVGTGYLTLVPYFGTTPDGHTTVSVQAMPSGDLWNPNATYTFDFGDGTVVGPSASAGQSHAYASVGDFDLTVTATYPGGRTVSAGQAISGTVVPRGPQLAVAATAGAGTAATVGVTAPVQTSLPVGTYFVNFGDGTAPVAYAVAAGSARLDATHTYAAAGTYPIMVTYFNADGYLLTEARPNPVSVTVPSS